MSRQLLKGTIIFSVAAGITSVLNLFFYVIGRLIGPEDFGALVALMSTVFVITIAQNVIDNLVTKVVAGNKLDVRDLSAQLRPLLIKAQFIGGFLFLVISFLFLQGFLKLDSILPLISLSLIFLSAFLLAMQRGILKGEHLLKQTAITQVIEILFKVLFAYVAVFLGLGISGILAGIALGSVLTYLISLAFTKDLRGEGSVKLSKLFNKRLLASVSASFIVLSLMISVDSIIARNKLPAYEAGLYGVVVTFGRFIYFMANSITLTLFPLSSSSSIRIRGNLLMQSGLMSLMIGVVSFFGFTLGGEVVITLLFGDKFLPAADYLPIEAVILTLFVILNQITVYLIAKDRHGYALVIVMGLLTQVGALMLFGRSIAQILDIQLVVMAGLVTVSLGYLFAVERIYGKPKI